MAHSTLRFDTTQAQRAIRLLGDRAPIAIARALNRANGSMRTLMARSVSQDLKLKVGTVRDELVMTPATQQRQVAMLSVAGKRIPVYDFNAKGPMPSRGKGRGVTARTPAGRYPRAFIARMPSGHMGVFERVGKTRLPIRELFGASLPHVFHKYADVVLARGNEALQKNLQSEINHLLRQIAA